MVASVTLKMFMRLIKPNHTRLISQLTTLIQKGVGGPLLRRTLSKIWKWFNLKMREMETKINNFINNSRSSMKSGRFWKVLPMSFVKKSTATGRSKETNWMKI